MIDDFKKSESSTTKDTAREDCSSRHLDYVNNLNYQIINYLEQLSSITGVQYKYHSYTFPGKGVIEIAAQEKTLINNLKIALDIPLIITSLLDTLVPIAFSTHLVDIESTHISRKNILTGYEAQQHH